MPAAPKPHHQSRRSDQTAWADPCMPASAYDLVCCLSNIVLCFLHASANATVDFGVVFFDFLECCCSITKKQSLINFNDAKVGWRLISTVAAAQIS